MIGLSATEPETLPSLFGKESSFRWIPGKRETKSANGQINPVESKTIQQWETPSLCLDISLEGGKLWCNACVFVCTQRCGLANLFRQISNVASSVGLALCNALRRFSLKYHLLFNIPVIYCTLWWSVDVKAKKLNKTNSMMKWRHAPAWLLSSANTGYKKRHQYICANGLAPE